MAKKLTFDKLPEAVEKILGILNSDESEHAALPELVRRMTVLEKKFDNLERLLSPDRPVMDKQTVFKVLKLRPKVVSELEATGVLSSHTEGRRTVFYEDEVVRFYMNQSAWRSAIEAASKSAADSAAEESSAPDAGSAPVAEVSTEGRQRVDVSVASKILDRSNAAIYQLTAGNRIPFHKEGSKVYFYTDELREWAISHPARKRRK
jgi:hypothetical protein